MNTSELAKFIGREADLHIPGNLYARVRITDCKQAYGSTRMLVTPVSGRGETWVYESRLSNISELCRAIT